MMSYRETVTYLDSFINYEKKANFPYKQSLKLARIKDFLRLIGDPQDSFSSVHVAGTKGKGSTCVFAANILSCAGFRTGLYTSPHLSDVRERIRIFYPRRALPKKQDFEGMISQKELVALVGRLKPALDAYCRTSVYGRLSFFEVYTALAFVYFKDKQVDVAVLETGLGGRLDATNVVSPSVCGITPVSFDHTDKLGHTLKEIAREKAGIIKGRRDMPQRRHTGAIPISAGYRAPGHRLIVISAPQKASVRAVLRTRCAQKKAVLYEVGNDIAIRSVKESRDEQVFSLTGPLGDFEDLHIRLQGEHQMVNAAVAVNLVAGLAKQKRFLLDDRQVRAGLYRTFWPARFEEIAGRPLIVLDSAHNVASAQVLRQVVQKRFGGQKIVLVTGISKDKDIRGICRILFPLAKTVIITQADNPRAEKPSRIRTVARGLVPAGSVFVQPLLPQALETAVKAAGQMGVVIVAGSIFVAAQARAALRSHKWLRHAQKKGFYALR